LILEVLRDKGVRATFFLIGQLATRYPEVVRQITGDGHSVGNHTYSHRALLHLLESRGEQAVLKEVKKGESSVRQAARFDRDYPLYLRPPYLNWDGRLDRIFRPIYNERIFTTGKCGSDFKWNGNNGNWSERDIVSINIKADEILRDVRQQDPHNLVIALHDSSEHGIRGPWKRFDTWMDRALPTLKALPSIIDYLKTSEVELVTLDSMDLTSVL
jgi:peptidoglycan/xylan/chitin deacetylase (PgdA/CDA1 family)